ncbi:MAG: exonuclease domain-containing protein [Proteobacteria bacterium]|nr:exonuclease domain-containing protein [Pseudomonadota bacterium]
MTFIQPRANSSAVDAASEKDQEAEEGTVGSRRRPPHKPQNKVPPKGRTKHLQEALNEGTYIVFDIETTGGNPEKNGITEIFALRYHQGQIIDTFYSMVNPGVSIPPIVRRMTGITNKMVRDAPPIKAVMPEFIKFIADDILVAHNTIGDMKFIRYFAQHECQHEIINYYLCTHLLVEKLAPNAPDKSLKGLGDFFQLNGDAQLHRAEADTYLTLELLKVLLGKLQEKGISCIADAIRFQGDFESGTRLGWAIKQEDLLNLPETSGVFYLYDFSGQVIFLSSAHNIAREVRRLLRLNTLPKQLLRAVLSSCEIRYQETPTPFAAALLEAESMVRHRFRFDPANWHQRSANFIYICKDENEYRLSTGSLTTDIVGLLGPIRGGRDINILLDHLARILDRKPSKKGLKVLAEEVPLLEAFFRRRTLQQSFREKVLSLLPKYQAGMRQLQRIRLELAAIRIPDDIHGPLVLTGILAVELSDSWHLYCLAGGRLHSEFTVAGDLVAGLRSEGLNTNIHRQLKEALQLRERESMPLSYHDAILLNRMFWWMFSGERQEGIRVLRLDELIQL